MPNIQTQTNSNNYFYPHLVLTDWFCSVSLFSYCYLFLFAAYFSMSLKFYRIIVTSRRRSFQMLLDWWSFDWKMGFWLRDTSCEWRAQFAKLLILNFVMEWSSNKLVVLKLMNEMILFYYCFLQFRVKRIPFFLLIFVTVIRYHRSAGEIYQPRCN